MLTLVVTTALTPLPQDRVLQYVPSPHGDYNAIVLKRPGGVTVRPSRYLVVLRRNERVGDRDSPLTIKTPYYSSDLTTADLASVTRIDIQWITDDSIVAWIDSRSQITIGPGDGALLDHGLPDGVKLVVKARYPRGR